MSTSRRARPFAETLYRDDPAGQDTEWQTSHGPDDRSYMILMYQEHAQLARQQEYLRALWSALLLGLGTLLALSARGDPRPWAYGALLVTVGGVGALALTKHYARYKLHIQVMRAFRTSLAETVRSDISHMSTAARLQHTRSHRLLGRVSLHGVFVLLALAMVGGGGEMIWRSLEADAFVMTASDDDTGGAVVHKPVAEPHVVAAGMP